MKKIISMFIIPLIIYINNFMQMYYLNGKELINGYAIWESSSVIVLCFWSLGLICKVCVGDNCIGRYMEKVQVTFFYIGIIVKFCSASLAALYVEVLYEYLYSSVYFIQGLLIAADLVITIYIYKAIYKIENAEVKEIKNGKRIPISCTIEEKNRVESVHARACVLLIGNASYVFIFGYSNTKLLSYGVLLINLILIMWFYKSIKQSKNLIQNYKDKYLTRAIGYLVISNIVNIYICGKPNDNIAFSYLFIFFFDIFSSTCVYCQVVEVIARTMLGMEEYLKLSSER